MEGLPTAGVGQTTPGLPMGVGVGGGGMARKARGTHRTGMFSC